MKKALLIACAFSALWACQNKTKPASSGFKIIGTDSLVISKDSANVRIVYPVSNNEAANKLLQSSILEQLQTESGHGKSSNFQALADSFAAGRKEMGKEYQLSTWYLHSEALSLCANDSLWSVVVQNEQFINGETPIKSMQTVNILHQKAQKVNSEHFIKASALPKIQEAAPSSPYGRYKFVGQVGLDSQNLHIYYASPMAAEDFMENIIPLDQAQDYLK